MPATPRSTAMPALVRGSRRSTRWPCAPRSAARGARESRPDEGEKVARRTRPPRGRSRCAISGARGMLGRSSLADNRRARQTARRAVDESSMKPLAAALASALAALGGCRDRAPGQTEPSVVATSATASSSATAAHPSVEEVPATARDARRLLAGEGHGGRAGDGDTPGLRRLHHPRRSTRPTSVRSSTRRPPRLCASRSS